MQEHHHRWSSGVLMLLLIPGVFSEVAVQQPPAVSAAVGQDVLLPCELQLSGESLMNKPVAYWSHWRGSESEQVWPSSHSRVQHLGSNQAPSNQSLLLRGIRWADGGSYLCKVSVRTKQRGSFRRNGTKSKLLLYDGPLFERCRLDQNLLCCQGKVTRDAGFSLAVLHDGQTLLAAADAAADADADQPITLSKAVALRGAGRYECRLLLGGGLVTERVFILNQTETGGGGANATSASSSLPGEFVRLSKRRIPCRTPFMRSSVAVVYPEPWLLYGVLLLVPGIVLLGLVTATLMCRRAAE